MAILATIRVLNDLLPAGRVAGVLVQLYEADGTYVTEGTTDIQGEADFLLPEEPYDVYLYKPGISVLPRQPQRIVVDHTALSNIFGITVHVTTLPETTNPNLCRVTGSLIGPGGSPTRDVKLAIMPTPQVLVVGGQAVSPQSQLFQQPDTRFKFDFTLLRKVDYDAYFVLQSGVQMTEPGRLYLKVPDAPAVDINNLLFPLPVAAEFSEDTLALPVSAIPDTSVALEVTYSDGSIRTQPPTWGGVILSVSDPDVLDVELVVDKLSIKAKQAGVATITAERVLGPGALWLPTVPDFTTGSVVVTVS